MDAQGAFQADGRSEYPSVMRANSGAQMHAHNGTRWNVVCPAQMEI